MRATFEPGERAIFARRLGLNPSCNDETLAEAAAEFFDGGRDWLDANRPVGTEEDDHFGEPAHRRIAAGARARRGEPAAVRPGGPAPRPQGRVTFGGSGYSTIDR